MYKDYGNNRIMIVCGKYEGCDKRCVEYLYGELASKVPYVLTVTEAENLTREQEEYYNIIAVGCRKTNSYIDRLCKEGHISVPENPEGYRIKVFDNPANSEKQIFALAGGSEVGALYAVSDFCNKYLPDSEITDKIKIVFIPLFTEKMKEVDYEEIPQIRERGIWTWGHVIYDYKRFIDNMIKLRMNVITVWNDVVPVNAKEFVRYAHEVGIKVIWGFSIGWGYEVDISDDNVLEKIISDALCHYKENYENLEGDGIYFQTFTETNDDTQNGINIAKQAADFVNKINRRFKESFGDIRLEFGLHATSVKNNLAEISKIDGDVEIAWEDCGAFPFLYSPHNVDDYNETVNLTRAIANLRGQDDKFSAVLKGLSCLDWTMFENQKGTFIMGVYSKKSIEGMYDARKKFWRRTNAFWLKNADKAQEIMKIMTETKNGKLCVQALVEDGLFEEKISFGTSVMAELMWNYDREINDILCTAAIMSDVDF